MTPASVQVDLVGLAVPGGGIGCLIAYPDIYAVRPAVILLNESFGGDEEMRALARRLADAGYVAALPDLFGRIAGPAKADEVAALSADRQAGRAASASLGDVQVQSDLGACLDLLKKLPAVRDHRVAVLGFCLGGAFALQAAGVHRRRLSAAVVYYGRIRDPDLTSDRPRHPIDALAGGCCPVQGHFGESDQHIPLADVADLRVRLAELDPEGAVYLYPGAGHSFFSEARPSYHAEAAARSWSRTMAFLKRHLDRP